ncbi:hypothetical protein [Caballeronia sp. NCTM5]|uniref:hypothetical protein n=1 Tax=Caballeronia sp. NCTM5 TaxID=2921755 RepID=UPI00202782C8|nr:hypothetical protein [Caballeronia sp. NCTM5]
MGALPSMPSLPARTGGGGAGGGRRGGGHAGGLHGGNLHIGPGGVGMGSVGMGLGLGMGGMAAMGAGYAAFAMSKAAVESAGEYQRQQAHFSLFGMSPEQNAEAKRYVEALNAPGASTIDKMRYFTEAQGVFRESGMQGDEALKAAKVMTPILSQMRYASALTDHPMDAQQEKAMLRFIEISGGLKDTARAAQLADLGFRTTTTSGGVVDWEQLRQARAIGGVSVKNMSDEAFFGWSEPIINELKGSGFGTGMMTSFNRLNGINKLTKQQLHEFLTLGGNADDLKKDMKVGGKDASELVKLGIWDPSKVAFNKAGGVDHYTGNPLKWADERAANPLKWHIDHVMPAYDRMGLSQGDRDRENAILYGTTGAKIFSLLEQQMERVMGGVDSWKKAHGLPQAVKATDATLTGQEQQFNAAWSDFKTQFGENILPQATKLIQAGTELVRFATIFDRDAAKEADYVKGGSSLWERTKRTFEWENGNAPGQQHEKTVAPPTGSTPMKAEVNVHIDGKKLATEVTSVVFKPLRGGAPLGSGLFDTSFGHPSSLNGY